LKCRSSADYSHSGYIVNGYRRKAGPIGLPALDDADAAAQ
jgi:hypothetical protein